MKIAMMQIIPLWLQRMPEGRTKRKAMDRFFIRLAALHASPNGGVRALSDAIGINYKTLSSQIHHHNTLGLTAETRDRLAELLGPAFLPPR